MTFNADHRMPRSATGSGSGLPAARAKRIDPLFSPHSCALVLSSAEESAPRYKVPSCETEECPIADGTRWNTCWFKDTNPDMTRETFDAHEEACDAHEEACSRLRPEASRDHQCSRSRLPPILFTVRSYGSSCGRLASRVPGRDNLHHCLGHYRSGIWL